MQHNMYYPPPQPAANPVFPNPGYSTKLIITNKNQTVINGRPEEGFFLRHTENSFDNVMSSLIAAGIHNISDNQNRISSSTFHRNTNLVGTYLLDKTNCNNNNNNHSKNKQKKLFNESNKYTNWDGNSSKYNANRDKKDDVIDFGVSGKSNSESCKTRINKPTSVQDIRGTIETFKETLNSNRQKENQPGAVVAAIKRTCDTICSQNQEFENSRKPKRKKKLSKIENFTLNTPPDLFQSKPNDYNNNDNKVSQKETTNSGINSSTLCAEIAVCSEVVAKKSSSREDASNDGNRNKNGSSPNVVDENTVKTRNKTVFENSIIVISSSDSSAEKSSSGRQRVRKQKNKLNRSQTHSSDVGSKLFKESDCETKSEITMPHSRTVKNSCGVASACKIENITTTTLDKSIISITSESSCPSSQKINRKRQKKIMRKHGKKQKIEDRDESDLGVSESGRNVDKLVEKKKLKVGKHTSVNNVANRKKTSIDITPESSSSEKLIRGRSRKRIIRSTRKEQTRNLTKYLDDNSESSTPISEKKESEKERKSTYVKEEVTKRLHSSVHKRKRSPVLFPMTPPYGVDDVKRVLKKNNLTDQVRDLGLLRNIVENEMIKNKETEKKRK